MVDFGVGPLLVGRFLSLVVGWLRVRSKVLVSQNLVVLFPMFLLEGIGWLRVSSPMGVLLVRLLLIADLMTMMVRSLRGTHSWHNVIVRGRLGGMQSLGAVSFVRYNVHTHFVLGSGMRNLLGLLGSFPVAVLVLVSNGFFVVACLHLLFRN